MKNPYRNLLLPLAIVSTVGVQAATLEWDTSNAPGIQGGSGTWDGAATWTPDGGTSNIAWNNATHSAHSAVFSTGTGRVSVNGNISLKGIVASTNETSSIGGRTLSYLIQGAGALDFGTQEGVIDTLASGSRSLQINNNLIGTGGLRVNAANAPATGESWLYLAGDNTGLTGGITVENGLVGVNNPDSLGTNAVVLDGNAGIFGPVNIGGPDTSAITNPGGILTAPAGYTLKSFRLVEAPALANTGFLRVRISTQEN